jgi:hypothetical protein
VPLQGQPDKHHYSTSDELSHDDDEKFWEDLALIANRQGGEDEASIEEILAGLDDEVDSSANAKPAEVDNSANPNPAQVDSSAKKSRPVSLLRDAAFLRAVEGLFAPGTSPNLGETSVIQSSPSTPSTQSTPSASSPTQSTPSTQAGQQRRRLLPWWHRLLASPPRSYRSPAQWRDTSDQLRVLYRHLALKTFGPVHTVNINLRRDIEALCREQPDQAGWFRARVARRLQQQLGCSPEFHLTMEEGDQHRLHFHGEIQCSADEAENVRKALRLAGGEWKQAPQHQAKTDPDPDQGWASYIAEDIWRVRFTRSFLPRYRDARSNDAITFTGNVASATKLLNQRAAELYSQHRAWLIANDVS